MKLVKVIASIVIYMCEHTVAKHLQIVHYNDVTLSTCGLNAYSSKPVENRCLKWLQMITDEKETLKTIKSGRFAKNGEFPHTVLIYSGNNEMSIHAKSTLSSQCTGSIINTFWILTAAHCIHKYPEKVLVIVGITDHPDNSRDVPYFTAEKYILHPNYSLKHTTDGWFEYDIALIKLEKEITIDILRANSVCLPSRSLTITHSELAIATGWGALNDHQRNDYRLKMTQITLGDHFYDPTQHPFILTEDVKYGSLCLGDSGGALVQYVAGRAVQIGLLYGGDVTNSTRADWCGEVIDTVFTAIPYHLNWIIETIRNN